MLHYIWCLVPPQITTQLLWILFICAVCNHRKVTDEANRETETWLFAVCDW